MGLPPGSRRGKYLPLASIFIVIFQLILSSREQNTRREPKIFVQNLPTNNDF